MHKANHLKNKRLVFLLHNNRSGSTYLSSMLSGLDGVGVTIESAFLSNIFRSKLTKITPNNLDSLLKILYSEKKFLDWMIDRENLESQLRSMNFPQSIENVTKLIFSNYFSDASVQIYIFKGTFLIHHLKEIYQHFNSPKFIHIYRDPRAVYRSQLNTFNSGTKILMSSDPVTFSLQWKGFLRRVKEIPSGDLCEVKYEDLILDTKKTLWNINRFLFGNKKDVPDIQELIKKSKYSNKIPEEQRYLHKNVSSLPLEDRINSWKSGISSMEALIIEHLCSNEMTEKNYQLSDIALWRIGIAQIVHSTATYMARFLREKMKKYLELQ